MQRNFVDSFNPCTYCVELSDKLMSWGTSINSGNFLSGVYLFQQMKVSELFLNSICGCWLQNRIHQTHREFKFCLRLFPGISPWLFLKSVCYLITRSPMELGTPNHM